MGEVGDVVVVKPWYRQFYLRRGGADWASDRVSDEGFAVGLEAIDGFVFIGTTMYGSPIAVALEVHASDPGARLGADRFAETCLVGSGDVAVHNWDPDDLPVMTRAVPAGDLQMRANWFGTAEAETHPDYHSGGVALSPERIVLDLWPMP